MYIHGLQIRHFELMCLSKPIFNTDHLARKCSNDTIKQDCSSNLFDCLLDLDEQRNDLISKPVVVHQV